MSSRCKWHLYIAVIIAALVGIPAHAAAKNRIYFAGFLGMNVMKEQDFTESSTGSSGQIILSNGYNFAGALGFHLTPQLRLEGEFSYLQNNLEGLNISGIGSFGLEGDVHTRLAMINLYYDFDVGWAVKPFVGAGIGYAWHSGSIDDISGFATDISDSASGYAWQVGGGVQYPVGDDMALVGAYRYLDGQNLDFGPYDIDYGAHEFRIGIKWDLPFK